MQNKILILFLSMICVGIFSSEADCFYFYKNFRDVHGKVVDAGTGDPIEGFAVLAYWGKDIYNAFDIGSKYYDAYTIATDSNGDFTIPGKGLRVLTRLQPVYFALYKSGYETFSVSDLLGDFKKYDIEKDKVKWLGDKVIIPLNKLSIEEMRRRGPLSPPSSVAPIEKVILWLRERDNEAEILGIKRTKKWQGESYE